MLRYFLSSRLVQGTLIGLVLFCVGIYLYIQWDLARFEANLPSPPQDTEGVLHGDDGEPADAHPTNDGDDGEPASQEQGGWEADVQPQAAGVPADYHGDPHFWIPGIAYEELITGDGGYSSEPIIPQEKRRKYEAQLARTWAEAGQIMTTEGPITPEARDQMRVEILVEGFSALDAAKFLISFNYGYEKYARDYADAALASNPDDFTTLYVWTYLQPEDAKRIQGYRRLVEMNPNSVRALLKLGGLLISTEKPLGNAAEAIPYLERAAALDPNLYQGAANSKLGSAYLKLGDGELALKYYKRAQQFYDSGHRRDLIELIEKGEIP